MKELIDLQDCDSRMSDIKEQKEQCPVKIKNLEENLSAFENKLKEESEKLETLKRETRKIDVEIEEIESKIEKSNAKLSNIKSNKEYRAALKEIDDLKKSQSLSEDKILEIMEQIEMLEARCAENDSKRGLLRNDFEKDRKEIMSQMESLEGDLRGLETERERLSGIIDEELLKRYSFIRERKGGVAVSPVIKGVCQACHLDIPPQHFNEVIRGDKLMTCPNCTRIIYWGEDERLVAKRG